MNHRAVSLMIGLILAANLSILGCAADDSLLVYFELNTPQLAAVGMVKKTT